MWGVCDLLFTIPLHAARRAMAAVVGFSIYLYPLRSDRPNRSWWASHPTTYVGCYKGRIFMAFRGPLRSSSKKFPISREPAHRLERHRHHTPFAKTKG